MGDIHDQKIETPTSDANYGKSLSVEPYGTEAIPDAERHGHPAQQFTLWFAANMVLAVLVTGFYSASFGLTVWQGLSAVAVGSLLGATLMGVLAGIGTKLGVAQQVQGRGPMGYFANFMPITLLTIVSAVGWTAANTVFAILALQTLVAIPFWVAATGIFAIQAAIAIWGHNLVHLVNKIASLILALLFVIITIVSVSKAEYTSAVNTDADQYMGVLAGWITLAGFAFAYVLTWTPFASDFSRYLPKDSSHARVMLYTAAGSFVSLMWLEGVGVLVSSFAGDLGAVEALARLTGAWAPIAMVTIVLSTFPVSAMNLYGGALSLLTIHIPVSRVVGVTLVALGGLSVTLWMQTDPYGLFYDFLTLLSYMVLPFSVILMLDYYSRLRPRLGHGAVEELFDMNRSVEWGFVAWIISCAISSLFWDSSLWTGPLNHYFSEWGDISYAVGAVAAVISYFALSKLPSAPLGARQSKSASPNRDEIMPAKSSLSDHEETLIIIDMQEIFRSPDSQWHVPGYEQAQASIEKLMAAWSGQVLWTRFVRDPAEMGSWQQYYERWSECRLPEESPAWNITLAGVRGPIISLPTFSKWGEQLQKLTTGTERLRLCGVATDCCVLATALGAVDAGKHVTVVAEACAGLTPKAHDQTLDVLKLLSPMVEVV